MAKFEIPLLSDPQSLTVTMVNIDYDLLVYWNSNSNNWNLSITDKNTKTVVINSIPLVTGVDLLAPFGYLNFSCQLIVENEDPLQSVPDRDNLGITTHLIFNVL